VAEPLPRRRARDGARELEVGRRGDRGAQTAADPSGRARDADPDAPAQRDAAPSGTLRITASRISSGVMGFFSFWNLPPWLAAFTYRNPSTATASVGSSNAGWFISRILAPVTVVPSADRSTRVTRLGWTPFWTAYRLPPASTSPSTPFSAAFGGTLRRAMRFV